MNDFSHNDQPISVPSEDRFGIDPFAAALSKSILKIKSPTGSVIALNGPWGSGKSSAVNLIRHHLDGSVQAGEIEVIDFTCWWFRGEEALALAFFRELYVGLSPTLGEKLKKSLPKLGARLVKAGAVLGGAADLAGAGGAGGVAGGAMEWLGGLIQQEEGVEKLHADLSKALAEQPRRFLVIIDDIDRLSPDEALLIFRLVKSVGRLPNVMYLLVYDRQLAEKIVSERFPSEGPHYLEKIVQAAFELPEPMATDVHRHLLAQIGSICGELAEDRVLRFMNLFYEGVAPEMRTPRDVARFTNSLAVTWPAVAGEIDLADFIALEVLRLLHPDIYRAVRQSKDRLCNLARNERDDGRTQAEEYEDLLLRSTEGVQRERLRRALMRIFPVLESIWSNMHYGADFARQWAAERRVCSSSHFDAYFRFAIGAEVLSATELDALIAKASDPEFVAAELRRAVTVTIEEGMLSVLAFKRSLSAGILDGGTGEISLGGSRLNRYMKDVENVTGHMGEGEAMAPAEEAVGVATMTEATLNSETEVGAGGTAIPVSAGEVFPEHAAGIEADPWQASTQLGAQLLAAFGAAGNPAAPAHPWIERDPESGAHSLKLPLPPPETAGKIADVLSMLANTLRGQRVL